MTWQGRVTKPFGRPRSKKVLSHSRWTDVTSAARLPPHMSQAYDRQLRVIVAQSRRGAVAVALPTPSISTIVIRQLEAFGLELLGLVGLISRTAMGGKRTEADRT